MRYSNELVWLAKQLEKQKVSDELSLWYALRQTSAKQSIKVDEQKRHVYITGEPQVLFQLTNLSESIAVFQNVVTFTSDKYSHPALQWMTITYYPPHCIQQIDEHQTFTLFVEGRLPIWSRTLFMENKICNVVGDILESTMSRFPNVTFYKPELFSYMDLLDDVVIKQAEVSYSTTQIAPEVPKQYILQLKSVHDHHKLLEILDETASSMLNKYWLQNSVPLPQWMPILLREINIYLSIRKQYMDKNNIVEKMKVWGARDKRIT